MVWVLPCLIHMMGYLNMLVSLYRPVPSSFWPRALLWIYIYIPIYITLTMYLATYWMNQTGNSCTCYIYLPTGRPYIQYHQDRTVCRTRKCRVGGGGGGVSPPDTLFSLFAVTGTERTWIFLSFSPSSSLLVWGRGAMQPDWLPFFCGDKTRQKKVARFLLVGANCICKSYRYGPILFPAHLYVQYIHTALIYTDIICVGVEKIYTWHTYS